MNDNLARSAHPKMLEKPLAYATENMAQETK
jgi:hypothetical protein